METTRVRRGHEEGAGSCALWIPLGVLDFQQETSQTARARARAPGAQEPGPCSRNPAVIASQTHSIERNVRLLALQLEDGRKTVVAAGAMIPVMRTKHVSDTTDHCSGFKNTGGSRERDAHGVTGRKHRSHRRKSSTRLRWSTRLRLLRYFCVVSTHKLFSLLP